MSEFPTINRQAIILLPTEACLAWAKACSGFDAASTSVTADREPTVYLIPDGKTDSQSYVRRHYKTMFEEELNSWYTDPELWPKDLSFKAFQRFFTIEMSSMVFDLADGKIEKDDD